MQKHAWLCLALTACSAPVAVDMSDPAAAAQELARTLGSETQDCAGLLSAQAVATFEQVGYRSLSCAPLKGSAAKARASLDKKYADKMSAPWETMAGTDQIAFYNFGTPEDVFVMLRDSDKLMVSGQR
ncbi:hypothetical protein [Deinococcus sp. Marseille-Q6407]|uniref:hypothetical protein n=1 Tax=Deinococcus sp. Marseille-Q6407 TaxID=2969223 RepID=UPI0021C21942|nr:hypothetical protein [Deinococcus sp. Marseille-Q6407]